LPDDAESARLLGLDGTLASDLGLVNDALGQVIRQVGNYGEIYDRNLTRFGISRSGTFNELAEHGGLLYAPPVR
jgi:general L-amino acid transport system substrate-binding protein